MTVRLATVKVRSYNRLTLQITLPTGALKHLQVLHGDTVELFAVKEGLLVKKA